MKRDYNSIAFTPEEVEQGLHAELLNYLVNFNSRQKSDEYFEIHVTSDGYCTIIEFEKIPYDHSFGGTFEYVDEDHIVMKEYVFPDNSIQYFGSDEEFNDVLEDWLKENPGWTKNEYGVWYNKDDSVSLDELMDRFPVIDDNEAEQKHSLDFED